MTPRIVSLLSLWLVAAALCVTYVSVRPEPSPQGPRTTSHQADIQILRDRPVGSWGAYLPRPILSKQSPHATAKAPLGSEQPRIEQFEKPQRVVEALKIQRATAYSSEPSRVGRAPTPKKQIVEALKEQRVAPYPPGSSRAVSAPTLKQQVVEALKIQRATPYSSEPSRVARAPTPKKQIVEALKIQRATPYSPEPSRVAGAPTPSEQGAEAPKEQRAAPYSPEASKVVRTPTPKQPEQALLGEDTEQLVPKRTAKVGKPRPTTKLDAAPKKNLAEKRSGTSRGLGLFALSADFGGPKRY